MLNFSMLAASKFMTKLGEIIGGFLAIIPQIMYFLYTSIASVLDIMQFLFRKLAGLDVYYVNEEAKTGDIVIEFIEGILGINEHYSGLTTVFWSMIIFGLIVLVLMTIFTVIKAHYNYDAKKSSNTYIIKSTVKAVVTMALVPLCTVFGLYMCQILFKTVDKITSPGSETAINEVFEAEAITNFKYAASDEKGKKRRYSSYDFFGAAEWSSTQTFSGIMFEVSANSANRVRKGIYSVDAEGRWDNADVFYTSSVSNQREKVARQIDFAFSNNLSLASSHTFQIAGFEEADGVIGYSLSYGASRAFAGGLINAKSFSKFNVGLVWYFYDLWGFNYILAFVGIAVCLALFSNILFGMILRIVFSIVLFLIAPPVIGIMPFDEGNGLKAWRKEFLSYLISAYAAVIGMNILFLMLPVFNTITFFNQSLLDGIVRMVVIISGLTLIKRFVAIISNFVGAKNLDEVGASSKKDTSKPIKKSLETTARLGVGAVNFKSLPKNIAKGLKGSAAADSAKRGAGKLIGKVKNSAVYNKLNQTMETVKSKFNNSKVGRGVSKIKQGGKKLKNATAKAAQRSKMLLTKAGQRLTKGINKALDNAAVKFVLGNLGIPVDPNSAGDYHEEEYVDANGQVKVRLVDKDGNEKKTGLAIIKNAITDLGKTVNDAIGKITGLKGMISKLDEDTDALDVIKGQINDFQKALNINTGVVFQTKKDKKKQAEEDMVNETIPSVQLNASVSKYALNAVTDLLNQFKNTRIT